jgi:hypothetical protein
VGTSDASRMPIWRRRLNLLGGIASLSLLGYWGYRAVTLEDRVKSACSEIVTGMTMPQVKSVASAKGLDARSRTSDVSFVVAPESMGEVGCRVTWKSELVTSSQYDGPTDDR